MDKPNLTGMKHLLIISLASLSLLFASCASDVEAVVLCDKCGVEEGAKGCCDADAEKCAKCSKIKGSAGCCK